MSAKSKEALHEEFEERAAIIEFDGKVKRDMAERLAHRLVYGVTPSSASATVSDPVKAISSTDN